MQITVEARLYDQRWCFLFFCGPIESSVAAEVARRGYAVLAAEADRGWFVTETRIKLTIETGASPTSASAIRAAVSDAILTATGEPAIAISVGGSVGSPGIGSPESTGEAIGEGVGRAFSTLQAAVIVGAAVLVIVLVKK